MDPLLAALLGGGGRQKKNALTFIDRGRGYGSKR